MLVLPTRLETELEQPFSRAEISPREAMAARLPAVVQPFLTWLTAKPAPGEEAKQRSAQSFVIGALAWMFGGCALTVLPFLMTEPMLAAWLLVPIGLTFTCCGLGLFQVVIFHHCSHGTVFATREANRRAGRLISALLLFKRFEDYQREHMIHHSAKKLLTEEDEFADFVLGLCGLEAGVSKRELWRRVALNCVSPVFHWRFFSRRVQASLFTGDTAHDWTGRVAWTVAIGASVATGTFWLFMLAWVLPVSILLQIATVFRILVEHSFPDAELIAARNKEFVCHASVGVFPGSQPPLERATTLTGAVAWTLWWAEMLTVQLFVRLFVLVGDAPCHDFHHRRPATRRWTSYIHARQEDLESGSPGFPAGYFETWGLMRAVDRMLASLAATAPETIGREPAHGHVAPELALGQRQAA
ncbi:fatty acid desaturase [Falsiroseomonas oryzae]|uniref:fatty acid desaturase n=1 Tax=Falsiroseomonas oryzae TaxID=2766473 RepID=UPI0022EA43E0|nr:fatty acid desaturase [Roseomonas sp. MO-31]